LTVLLRLSGVTLRRGGRILFEDFDLDLRPGDTVQVAGPNGSGKSSLLRLAAGLLRAERGSVERASVTLADDHLGLDRELPLRRALAFWSAHDLDGALDALGLAELAHIPVRLLSSGQAKRATLARAAASATPLWLLDEPLNGLDADGTERLGRLIQQHVATGGGVLAASHQPLPGEWRRIELGQVAAQ
jgi:heme exporter protein A